MQIGWVAVGGLRKGGDKRAALVDEAACRCFFSPFYLLMILRAKLFGTLFSVRQVGELLVTFFSFPLFFSDGKVYALGGMGADTAPQALVRLYDAEKDQWQPLTSMPTPRYGATPFLIGNRIYLMGEASTSTFSHFKTFCQEH